MQSEKDQLNALFAAILGSAATIAVVSASLYYIGYLYLLGFYRAFGIPIDSLSLTFQVIASQSRIVFIPTIIIIIYAYVFLKTEGRPIWIINGIISINIFPHIPEFLTEKTSGNLEESLRGLIRSKFILIIMSLVLVLIISFIIPLFGEYQAKNPGNFPLGILETPIPNVIVYSNEPLSGIEPYSIENSTNNNTFIYQNFWLVTSTEKYFYLFSRKNGTYEIPREKILLVYPPDMQKINLR